MSEENETQGLSTSLNDGAPRVMGGRRFYSSAAVRCQPWILSCAWRLLLLLAFLLNLATQVSEGQTVKRVVRSGGCSRYSVRVPSVFRFALVPSLVAEFQKSMRLTGGVPGWPGCYM